MINKITRPALHIALVLTAASFCTAPLTASAAEEMLLASAAKTQYEDLGSLALKNRQAQINQLKRMLADKEDKLEAVAKKIKKQTRLKSDYKALKKALTAKENQISRLQEQKKMLKGNVTFNERTQGELHLLMQEMEALFRDHDLLKAQLNAVKEEKDALVVSQKNKTDELKALRDQLAKAQGEQGQLAEEKQQLQSALQALKAQHQMAMDTKTTLASSLSELKGAHSVLMQDQEVVQTSLTSLETERAMLLKDKQVAEVRAQDYETLQSKLKNMQTEKRALEETRQTQLIELDNVKGTLDELKVEYEALNRAHADVSTLFSDYDRLNAQLQKLALEKQALMDKDLARAGELEALKTELSALQTRPQLPPPSVSKTSLVVEVAKDIQVRAPEPVPEPIAPTTLPHAPALEPSGEEDLQSLVAGSINGLNRFETEPTQTQAGLQNKEFAAIAPPKTRLVHPLGDWPLPVRKPSELLKPSPSVPAISPAELPKAIADTGKTHGPSPVTEEQAIAPEIPEISALHPSVSERDFGFLDKPSVRQPAYPDEVFYSDEMTDAQRMEQKMMASVGQALRPKPPMPQAVSSLYGGPETQTTLFKTPRPENESAEFEPASVSSSQALEVLSPAMSETEIENRFPDVKPKVPQYFDPSVNVYGLLQAAYGYVPETFGLLSGVSGNDRLVYQWSDNGVYASAEQRAISEADFDDLTREYLLKTEGRCAGDFAAIPVDTQDINAVRVDTYDIACVVGDKPVNAAASLVMFGHEGTFSVISYESAAEHVEKAMDKREKMVQTLERSRFL